MRDSVTAFPLTYQPIENTERWDFSSIYYDGQHAYDGPGIDVNDEPVYFAGARLGACWTGGDEAEILDATLVFSAWCMTHDFRFSSARPWLSRLANAREVKWDEAFAEALANRAESVLRGAALVGCLRAIGGMLYRRPNGRPAIARRAREAFDNCGAVYGLADLLADDAHAHLCFAERSVLPPEKSPDPDRSELVRRTLVTRGWERLAAAAVVAYDEPWSPFVQYRLRHELKEHRSAQSLMEPSRRGLIRIIETIVEAVECRWPDAQRRWREAPPRDEIYVYFIVRPRPGEPTAETQEVAAMVTETRQAAGSWHQLV
jgi:hypothetical protein